MKYKVDHTESGLYFTLTMTVSILILGNLLFSIDLNIWLIVITGLFLAIFALNHVYEKNVSKHITVEVLDKELRRYKGQEGTLRIKVTQAGLMPVLGATLNLTAGDEISFKDELSLKIRQQTETEVEFSVLPKSSTILEIPFHSTKRGVSNIIKSDIKIPRLLGFNSIVLIQKGGSNHEVIIYPDRHAFHNEELKIKMHQGMFSQNQSLYFDPMLTNGTRDYESFDNVRDIHWKLSAKSGGLKTKIYEKTTHTSWMILINLRSRKTYAPPGNIEELFEKVAFLTGVAAEKGIPYRIISNMKTFDNQRFFKLGEGSGKLHYRYSLEALARIKTVTFTISFDNFLKHIRQYEDMPTHIIFTGKTDALIDKELAYFNAKGATIYNLGEHGLEPYNAMVKRVVE